MKNLRAGFPLALALLASLVLAAAAAAKPPATVRVIPVWAGITHGKPVAGGIVVARSAQGKRLAPPARTASTGVASLLAPKRLPRNFVVEVRKAGKQGKGPVLRAAVRNWKRSRVVYVDPFSTVVDAYARLHGGIGFGKATLRVQRHLGIGPETRHPEAATFWSERAFSGRHFARAAGKHKGIAAFSTRIAREVDRSRKPHRFRHKAAKKREHKASDTAGARISTETAGRSVALNAERQRTEEELMDAAKTAAAMATGSPSAILQLGELLDKLLGGGDTAVLKQISTQLETLQAGISNLEQEVGAVNAEVSMAAYSNAVSHYQSTQETIDTAWDYYVNAIAMAAANAGGKEAQEKQEAESKALAQRLKALGDTIPSAYAVPFDDGSPGLIAWAQNAFAKQQFGGTMTSYNQQISRAAGFQWWTYWWKDLLLHTEKWDSKETVGDEITPLQVERLTKESVKGLQLATEDEYGETLPESLVYAISPGKLYSVGTVWNVEPSLAPPAAGQNSWKLATLPEANAIPANSTGLMEAMQAAMPTYPANPNKSMEGILGTQPNNGAGPSYHGTGGGYGEPPETEFIEEQTHMLALAPAAGSECEGRWSWLTNGQGSSNLTGAPIIELCPALNLESQATVPTVCAQVLKPGVFYGWSESFPLQDWNGLWRHEKAIEFKTCNDVDYWQKAGSDYPGLNWGDGVFAGSSPLSTAIITSNSPSAYYALWTRPIGPKDDFLVGPVTNSG